MDEPQFVVQYVYTDTKKEIGICEKPRKSRTQIKVQDTLVVAIIKFYFVAKEQ